MASELLERLFGKALSDCPWPSYDAALALDTEITIAIQVNGKLRGDLNAARGAEPTISAASR